jgi:hypothetical protein
MAKTLKSDRKIKHIRYGDLRKAIEMWHASEVHDDNATPSNHCGGATQHPTTLLTPGNQRSVAQQTQ